MKHHHRLPAVILATLLAVGAAAPAQANDYIWCVLQDTQDGRARAFFSDVFLGEYAETQSYQSAFWSHVDARWGLGWGPSVTCHYEESHGEARAASDDFAASYGHGLVIRTYWSY